MVHRIATSEQYRDSPTAVRCAWAFRDFLDAHILLDVVDEERAVVEAEPWPVGTSSASCSCGWGSTSAPRRSTGMDYLQKRIEELKEDMDRLDRAAAAAVGG
jgi:hypothetical protein